MVLEQPSQIPRSLSPSAYRRAIFFARTARDLAAGQLVGGATCMLTLLLTGGSLPAISLDVLVGLSLAMGVASSTAVTLGERATEDTPPRWWHSIASVGPLSALVAAAGYLVLNLAIPITGSVAHGTTEWWAIVALSIFATLGGAIGRRLVEVVLDSLTRRHARLDALSDEDLCRLAAAIRADADRAA